MLRRFGWAPRRDHHQTGIPNAALPPFVNEIASEPLYLSPIESRLKIRLQRKRVNVQDDGMRIIGVCTKHLPPVHS
jgi:hypothetical protein